MSGFFKQAWQSAMGGQDGANGAVGATPPESAAIDPAARPDADGGAANAQPKAELAPAAAAAELATREAEAAAQKAKMYTGWAKIQQAQERAREALGSGNHKEAYSTYTKCLEELRPRNSSERCKLLCNRSMAYAKSSNFKAALEDGESAIAAMPRRAHAAGHGRHDEPALRRTHRPSQQTRLR